LSPLGVIDMSANPRRIYQDFSLNFTVLVSFILYINRSAQVADDRNTQIVLKHYAGLLQNVFK
jgi:hypothetical protein